MMSGISTRTGVAIALGFAGLKTITLTNHTLTDTANLGVVVVVPGLDLGGFCSRSSDQVDGGILWSAGIVRRNAQIVRTFTAVVDENEQTVFDSPFGQPFAVLIFASNEDSSGLGGDQWTGATYPVTLTG